MFRLPPAAESREATPLTSSPGFNHTQSGMIWRHPSANRLIIGERSPLDSNQVKTERQRNHNLALALARDQSASRRPGSALSNRWPSISGLYTEVAGAAAKGFRSPCLRHLPVQGN